MLRLFIRLLLSAVRYCTIENTRGPPALFYVYKHLTLDSLKSLSGYLPCLEAVPRLILGGSHLRLGLGLGLGLLRVGVRVGVRARVRLGNMVRIYGKG